jgi:dipeptidyl-peptidase-4
MTLNLLFRAPDVYRMGMSVAPVPDQRLYDTIYQERYMGLPQENPDGYREGSPLTYADQLEGDLLIVHGTGDDNVHYQGTERLINALVAANKPFTMMAYPNRSHGIFEGRNTTRHLFELLTRYLHEHLPVTTVPQLQSAEERVGAADVPGGN